jgi:hypothetical protein
MAIHKTVKVENWSIEMFQVGSVRVGKDEFLPSFDVVEYRRDSKGQWNSVRACDGLVGTEAAGAYFNGRIAEVTAGISK